MYKALYKLRSPLAPWQVLGTYSNEADAINAALRKKRAGALLVRVQSKSDALVYIN